MTPPTFSIIAHRGASGYALENSLAAFNKAVQLKAHMLEMDIQATKDGQLVVMHDFTLNRTCQGAGKIKKMNFGELSSIKLKNNEHIPTLEDLIHHFGHRTQFDIELKAANIEKRVCNLVEKHDLSSQVLISSFSFKSLKKLHQIAPYLELGFLIPPFIFHRIRIPSKKLVDKGIRVLLPHYSLITKPMVKKAHDRGLKIIPWTVNTVGMAYKLKKIYRVDGFITDYPDLLNFAPSNPLPLENIKFSVA
jgi:glycerophosphoryl diester phosphodiesterase